jgi:hypothetical protein
MSDAPIADPADLRTTYEGPVETQGQMVARCLPDL